MLVWSIVAGGCVLGLAAAHFDAARSRQSTWLGKRLRAYYEWNWGISADSIWLQLTLIASGVLLTILGLLAVLYGRAVRV